MRRQHLAAGVNPLNGLPWPEGEPRSGASTVEPVLNGLGADHRLCARQVFSKRSLASCFRRFTAIELDGSLSAG